MKLVSSERKLSEKTFEGIQFLKDITDRKSFKNFAAYCRLSKDLNKSFIVLITRLILTMLFCNCQLFRNCQLADL